mmetsp:Transcript_4746/g.11943  ORF Transcript_4746/g.11943 Transcript_4746/m.11943 type:complete len:247 (+) Transcript_4746:1007-1747(+)
MPGLLRRPDDAVLLPHCGLPQARRRDDAPHPAQVHRGARRRRSSAWRWHHPLVVEQDALAGPGRHRGRLAHAVPAWHLLPGGLGARRICRGHRRDAAGHARVRARALLGHHAAGSDAPRLGTRHSVLRHQGGAADGREEGQEKHFQWPHPRDRRPPRLEVRAGVRALGRLRRALRGGLHHQAQQGADRRVPPVQHHPFEVDDFGGLQRPAHPGAAGCEDGGVAGGSKAVGGGPQCRIQGDHQHQHG